MVEEMDPTETSDRETLEGFLIDNPQLERLEVLLGEFNFFEATCSATSGVPGDDADVFGDVLGIV